MKILWLFPPSPIEGEYPLVSQNRWFKYLPEQTNNIYPILASYGITMIKEAGHQIDFIDAPTLRLTGEEVNRKIEHGNYDLVILEGRTAIINWVLWWAAAIKFWDNPPKVALYGDHVMATEKDIVKNPFVDYVIHCGDYDYGAYRLVKFIDGGYPQTAHPPKVEHFPLMTESELDSLPMVDRNLVPWKPYTESWKHRDEFGWVQSQRGCHATCTFCAWNHIFWECRVRSMSPYRIVQEYVHMKEKYGIREVLDDSDTFYEDWGRKFAMKLLAEDLDIFWNVQTRVDEIKHIGSWELMYAAGLHVVKLGADGGSDVTLHEIAKGHTVQDTRNAVRKLKKIGIEVHINMILGWPWEGKKVSYDVIKFVKSLKPNQAQFSLIEPFPGTPIYRQALKNGWFAVDPEDWDKWNMKGPVLQGMMSAEEIKKLHRDAWHDFYINPRFMFGQLLKSTKLMFSEHNFESFRHLWRGYRAVKVNMKAME